MKVIKFLAVLLIITMVISCNNQGATKKSLNNDIDSVSYALGLDMAYKLKQNFSEVEEDLFIQGFKNGIDSTDILVKNNEIDNILRAYFQKRQVELQKKGQEEALLKAEKDFAGTKKKGIKFLEDNKSKEGILITESGLQYIVLKEGSGEKPKASSKVRVHYHGTSIDGKVFDSSVDRGTPTELVASQFIKGFSEGLQLMNVGSKYKFFIPQELAYGATPRQGGPIKPFEALIFEVELLAIVQ